MALVRQLWPKAEAQLPSSARPPKAKEAQNGAVVDVAVAPSKKPPQAPRPHATNWSSGGKRDTVVCGPYPPLFAVLPPLPKTPTRSKLNPQ